MKWSQSFTSKVWDRLSTAPFLLNNLFKQMAICAVSVRCDVSINTQRQFRNLERQKRAVKHVVFLFRCLLLFTLLAPCCEQTDCMPWLWGTFYIHEVTCSREVQLLLPGDFSEPPFSRRSGNGRALLLRGCVVKFARWKRFDIRW